MISHRSERCSLNFWPCSRIASTASKANVYSPRTSAAIVAERLTLEQVLRAVDVFIRSLGLPRRLAEQEYEAELRRIAYHQRRNAEASRSHRKKHIADYLAMGIDPDQIKSVEPKSS